MEMTDCIACSRSMQFIDSHFLSRKCSLISICHCSRLNISVYCFHHVTIFCERWLDFALAYMYSGAPGSSECTNYAYFEQLDLFGGARVGSIHGCYRTSSGHHKLASSHNPIKCSLPCDEWLCYLCNIQGSC